MKSKTQQELEARLSEPGYFAGPPPASLGFQGVLPSDGMYEYFSAPGVREKLPVLGYQIVDNKDGTFQLGLLYEQPDEDGGLTGAVGGARYKLNPTTKQYEYNLQATEKSTRGEAGGVTGNSDGSGDGSSGGSGGGTRSASGARLTPEQEEARQERKSAYDLLFQQFDQYGLGALVTPLRNLIEEGISPSEFTLRLRETDAYKKRFAANAGRIQKGLRALSEAEYIGLEDQYQNVMRNYGLPASYYTRGDMGRQEGFEKFISGDVSATELEDRIITAQNRVINAAPEVSKALREFYPEITGGDILAYALDPNQAIANIKRKVGAAEIGAGAIRSGLTTGLARAEELQRYGVTGEQAVAGFGTIASGLERGRQLSQIYQQPDYTQAVAEAEVFALPAAEQARRQRRKLGQLETAEFGGTSGMTGGALSRERAGQY